MLKINELKKAIRKANVDTMIGIWEHMHYSEKEDIRIILSRTNVPWTFNSIENILLHNDTLLLAVYNHADEAEKRDLEILASMV